jgi:hypothetical protein
LIQIAPSDHVLEIFWKPASALDCTLPGFQRRAFFGNFEGAVIGDVIDQSAPFPKQECIGTPVSG